MLTHHQFGMTNCKCVGEALAPSFSVDAGAMHFRLRLAHETVSIKRQMAELREGLSQDEGLIEATFALTRGMQWDRNDQVGIKQRRTLLCSQHLFSYASSHVGPALELKN